jgi:hypothetical protein
MPTKTKVVRKDSAVNGRFYEIDGASYPSVTHILGCIGKPALIAWSASTERAACTEAAADLYQEWCAQLVPPQMPRESYLATLTARLGLVKAHQKELAKAGEIGTQIHKMIEWMMRTAIGADAGPKPVISDKALWAVMAFEDFAKSVNLKPVVIEHTVYSKVHQYAGTMDLLARVNGVLTLLDFKSGKAVYPESFLQSAAYSVALEEMGFALPASALILRLPKVDTDPAFEVVTVPPARELFPVFLATKQLWAWTYQNDQDYRARRSGAAA